MSPATIYAVIRGTYCRPNAYTGIIVDVKFLSCIYCRRRQYIPKFGAYIVAQLCKTYFRDHEGRNMIASVNSERERTVWQRIFEYSIVAWSCRSSSKFFLVEHSHYFLLVQSTVSCRTVALLSSKVGIRNHRPFTSPPSKPLESGEVQFCR